MVVEYTQCALLHNDHSIKVYWNCTGMMGGSLMATAAYFWLCGIVMHNKSCMFKLCCIECMATATCLLNTHGWQVW